MYQGLNYMKTSAVATPYWPTNVKPPVNQANLPYNYKNYVHNYNYAKLKYEPNFYKNVKYFPQLNTNNFYNYPNFNELKAIFKSNTSLDTGTGDGTSNEDLLDYLKDQIEYQSSEFDRDSDHSDFTVNSNYFEKLLSKKNISDETLKKLERNQNCLGMLIEGDLIEYVENECDVEERDTARKWAVYMGNSMIMRFERKSQSIVYQPYWKIAKNNFIFINRDLDKRLFTLPIYETLNKARSAYSNRKKMCKNFSSDKNFAMWCRFNINKSDIDFATDFKNGKVYSPRDAKEFILNKFLNSLDFAVNDAKK